MTIYTDGELRNYVRSLLPDYKDSSLELLTITAIEDEKGEAVTLQFHYGVDGHEW